MLLILFLSQHLFVTSLQGRVLPNFEEESSRQVIPQLLARSVEELNRWLVPTPMIRASSSYDLVPQVARKIHDGGLMARHLPLTRLVKRGRETEGLWGPGGARVGRAPERVQGLMQVFKPFFARSSPQIIRTVQHTGFLERIFKWSDNNRTVKRKTPIQYVRSRTNICYSYKTL